jgi:hypothetical protein
VPHWARIDEGFSPWYALPDGSLVELLDFALFANLLVRLLEIAIPSR